MSIQLKNLNILMQDECDEMGPCMCPNTDLIHQQVQQGWRLILLPWLATIQRALRKKTVFKKKGFQTTGNLWAKTCFDNEVLASVF